MTHDIDYYEPWTPAEAAKYCRMGRKLFNSCVRPFIREKRFHIGRNAGLYFASGEVKEFWRRTFEGPNEIDLKRQRVAAEVARERQRLGLPPISGG